MDGIFGAYWYDVLIKLTTFCIVESLTLKNMPNQDTVKPIVRSEVSGYPTGFV